MADGDLRAFPYEETAKIAIPDRELTNIADTWRSWCKLMFKLSVIQLVLALPVTGTSLLEFDEHSFLYKIRSCPAGWCFIIQFGKSIQFWEVVGDRFNEAGRVCAGDLVKECNAMNYGQDGLIPAPADRGPDYCDPKY